MTDASRDSPVSHDPTGVNPPLDEQHAARELRRAGLTRREIARSLGMSTWRVTELLAGEPPQHPGLRARAKDDLRERARDLRRSGRTVGDIAEALAVSTSSVSLWTGDLPKPPRRSYGHRRVAAARQAQWSSFLRARKAERQANKAEAARSVGSLTERELLLVGTALYWAEGGKDKPYHRRESLRFINSDAGVIQVYLRWLAALGIEPDRWTFGLAIHDSADVDRAAAYWLHVVGPGGRWLKPSLKRHNPRSARRKIGDDYHGCLAVRVRQSRREYQRMDGLWHGIVGALSGVV